MKSVELKISAPAAIIGGLNAGIAIALMTAFLGSAMGMRALNSELTALHIILACLVTNILGGIVFLFLMTRTNYPAHLYLLICLLAATLASAKLLVFPPVGGFTSIAYVLHYFAAISSAVLLPFLVGHRPYVWEGNAQITNGGIKAPYPSAGRILLSFSAIGGSISSLVMDFNESHVYNPIWPSHARYHGFLFMNLLVAVGSLSLFLLWRPAPSTEDALRVRIAAFLSTVIPVCFLLPLLIPEASSWPDGFRVTMPINGNIMMVVIMLFLTGLGYALMQSPNHTEKINKETYHWPSTIRH